MRYLILIVLAAQLVLLSGCANRHKMPNMDTLCLRQLTQAENLYRQLGKDRDRRITDLADNLITGAKIARDHREFSKCISQSGRASKLLDPNALLTVQVGTSLYQIEQ